MYLDKDCAALAVLVQPIVQAVICHTKGGLLYGALATVLASVPLSRLAEVSFILIREAGIIQGVIDLERGVLVFVVNVCIVCAELGGNMVPSPQGQPHASRE